MSKEERTFHRAVQDQARRRRERDENFRRPREPRIPDHVTARRSQARNDPPEDFDDKPEPARPPRREPSSTARPSTKPAPQRAPRRSAARRTSARRRVSPVRKVAKAATAPFGGAVSAGWTLASGSLALILVYIALRDAGGVSAFARSVSAGIRRFADPYEPLFATKAETTARPIPRRWNHTRAGRPYVGHQRGGHTGNTPYTQTGKGTYGGKPQF